MYETLCSAPIADNAEALSQFYPQLLFQSRPQSEVAFQKEKHKG